MSRRHNKAADILAACIVGVLLALAALHWTLTECIQC